MSNCLALNSYEWNSLIATISWFHLRAYCSLGSLVLGIRRRPQDSPGLDSVFISVGEYERVQKKAFTNWVNSHLMKVCAVIFLVCVGLRASGLFYCGSRASLPLSPFSTSPVHLLSVALFLCLPFPTYCMLLCLGGCLLVLTVFSLL